MASLIVAGLLLAIAGRSFASFPFGQVYPFDIDSLLTCYVDNPRFGLEDEPRFIPEEIPRLPFAQAVGERPEVWLPGPPEYAIPNGIPNIRRLVDFLGDDYDTLLTSFSRPTSAAPRGCEVRASAPGSGGNFKVHISVDQDPTPFILNQPPQAILDGSPVPLDLFLVRERNESIRDNSAVENPAANTTRITPQIIESVELALLIQANNEQELCEIWVGLCPLGTTWAELPDGYLPKFFAQGTCSGKNCSFPRGKHCEEDFEYTAYVTVLRWDCCFDRALGQIQWACGWRKVAVPLICDCVCACTEQNVGRSGAVN